MTQPVYTPLIYPQKVQLRRSLSGWALYAVAAALWGILVSLHIQSVYTVWLPKLGGTILIAVLFLTLPSALLMGVWSQTWQRGERFAFRDGLFVWLVSGFVLPALFMIELLIRGMTGFSVYPPARVFVSYSNLQTIEAHLKEHAPNTKMHVRVKGVLSEPSIETIVPLKLEVREWIMNGELDRALMMASLFPELKASKAFTRAQGERYLTSPELSMWRTMLRDNPPATLSTSSLHQEAWLRLSGEVPLSKRIEGVDP